MKKTDIVFITLIYRNYYDLIDLSESLSENVDCQYNVIVVDAYFDDKTSDSIKSYTQKYKFEYIQTPNKGYGYGNNRGIEYANKHFIYNYIVVCNPDTILKSKLNLINLSKYGDCVAPRISTKTGKKQNPYWPYENKLSELLIYRGYKNNLSFLIYSGVALNKILRGIFITLNYLSLGRISHIYACHGSFVIMKENFLKGCNFSYDENIFLYYEEAYLANFVKKSGKIADYVKDINFFHKEDGSMNIANIIEYPYLKKSYEYYYERYRLDAKISDYSSHI